LESPAEGLRPSANSKESKIVHIEGFVERGRQIIANIINGDEEASAAQNTALRYALTYGDSRRKRTANANSN